MNGCVSHISPSNKHLARCEEGKRKDVGVAKGPYKPYDLPDSEMDRGPKHVINTENAVLTLGISVRKICQGINFTFGRAHQNPSFFSYGRKKNSVPLMSGNENVSGIFARDRYKQERVPKVEKTIEESIAGSPKGSNSYGDGAPIVVP